MSDMLGSHLRGQASGSNGKDPLSGHSGHLSVEQQTALDVLKENLTKSGIYKAHNGDTAIAPSGMNVNGTTTADRDSHDQTTLLRFLRARKFDPIAAEKQLSDTEAWRIEHKVMDLYHNFNVDDFENGKRFYPVWTGRRDRQGLPLYAYRLASLAGPMSKQLHALTAKQRWERIVALQEFSIGFTLPLCSSIPHVDIGKSGLPTLSNDHAPNRPVAEGATPVSSVTTIIDLAGISFTSVWGLRGHLQEASTLCTAHYPETINTIAIVNAPSFFSTVWGWIKKWFDEGTANKIHVLGKDNPGKTLRLLIEPQHLPKAYGGELEWVFGDAPSLDEDAKRVLGKGGSPNGGEMPKGPVLWVEGKLVRGA